MMSLSRNLEAFLETAGRTALVEVVRTRGSVPRETGAFMLVSAFLTHGTIGGGQLEYMAIDKARQMLAGRGSGYPTPTPDLRSDPALKGEGEVVTLDIPLGPEIGQCCGGRVEVAIRLVTDAMKADLMRSVEAEAAAMPHIYVFGGGHVGHALAGALSLLPVRTVIIETRADALEGMPSGVETRLTPMPEEVVRDAAAGAAFMVLTHDHALDFLIVAEALKRSDTAYVGMIGSKTKKATFRSWFLKSAGGNEAQFSRLVSPIGGEAVKDKRPAVIAALAAAEVMTALAAFEQEPVSAPAR
ncbi:MAG: xanthine dehydrogenase accessory protein XdhC [Mesorhizobium sp.]|nr:xanthine dehydrogenase accessory protein XdhC [Mesorhizobium sp.]MBL8578438.1 xanthine dehydrogenase accessory protein XdhC [Mesorhizobium sp.]